MIDYGRASGVDLLIGDFNTGNNDLDKDPKGARFHCAQMPGRLIGHVLGFKGLERRAVVLVVNEDQHSNAPASACTSDCHVPVTNSSCAGILTSFAKSAALIWPTG